MMDKHKQRSAPFVNFKGSKGAITSPVCDVELQSALSLEELKMVKEGIALGANAQQTGLS